MEDLNDILDSSQHPNDNVGGASDQQQPDAGEGSSGAAAGDGAAVAEHGEGAANVKTEGGAGGKVKVEGDNAGNQSRGRRGRGGSGGGGGGGGRDKEEEPSRGLHLRNLPGTSTSSARCAEGEATVWWYAWGASAGTAIPRRPARHPRTTPLCFTRLPRQPCPTHATRPRHPRPPTPRPYAFVAQMAC